MGDGIEEEGEADEGDLPYLMMLPETGKLVAVEIVAVAIVAVAIADLPGVDGVAVLLLK